MFKTIKETFLNDHIYIGKKRIRALSLSWFIIRLINLCMVGLCAWLLYVGMWLAMG